MTAFKSSHSNAKVTEETVTRVTAMVPGNIVVFDLNGKAIDSGIPVSGIPSRVIDPATITLLTTNANWNDKNQYLNTAPLIVGQKENDYYSDANHRYYFTSATTVMRIPYAYL